MKNATSRKHGETPNANDIGLGHTGLKMEAKDWVCLEKVLGGPGWRYSGKRGWRKLVLRIARRDAVLREKWHLRGHRLRTLAKLISGIVEPAPGVENTELYRLVPTPTIVKNSRWQIVPPQTQVIHTVYALHEPETRAKP